MIDTSANQGEDGLKTMGDLAESASSCNGPKAQPGVSDVSDFRL